MVKNIKTLLFTLLFMATSVLAVDVVAPKGSPRGTTVDDFMPHPISTKEFNETWSYQFVFDNGTRAFVNYAILYVPGSGTKLGCDMTLWNFKGKTYTVGRQYPPERLKADKASATLNIKNEYLMEKKPGKGHHVLFSADKDGKFLLDVTFESAEAGKTIGNGVWNVGSSKMGQFVHIPYGRVSGKIAYNEDTLQVKGYAYMDQIWQTVQATDIAARSINISTNARSPLFAGRISMTNDGKAMGYAIYNGPEGNRVVTAKSVKDGDTNYSGKGFPKGNLNIEWNDDTPALQFAANKTYQKASILDKIDGWFAKKAFKVAAGGEVFFYRGRSDGSHGKKIDWCITGAKD